MSRTVRDATFDVFRRRGLTTLFSNPGSTEVPFLAGLPDDLRFVLGLHEGSVLGLATGLRDRPRRAGARARAHDRRPRQLRRRHRDRARQPGAARDHRRPAGPAAPRLRAVPGRTPARPRRRVPGLGRPARSRAGRARRDRPRLPRSGDGARPGDRRSCRWTTGCRRPTPSARTPRPGRVLRARAVDEAAVDELAAFLESGRSPALVVGAGADEPETWEALVELAERLVAPVFQESFGARAGFPQDHRLFAGFLPADRPRLRERLAPYDAVLVVGAGAFRQSPWTPGPLHRATGRGSRSSATTRTRCTAARSSSRCSRRPQPSARALAAPAAAARRRAAAAVPAPAAARAARARASR